MEHTEKAEARDDEEGGFDFGAFVDWGSYAVFAIRRHKAALILGPTLAVCLAGAALWALPATYQAETTLLAERTQMLASLGELRRGDAPTDAGSVSDAVLRRDNTLALIQQTGLVEHWRRTRSPAGRILDWLRARTSGPMSDHDLVDGLVRILEGKIYAWSREGRVTLGVYWHEPAMAYRLVNAIQTNFLEQNHLKDVAVIEDAVALLEVRVDEARQAAEAEVERAARSPRRASSSTPTVRESAPPPSVDPDLLRLQTAIGIKRRAVEDLESFRQRRISELQAQLAEQQSVYASSHPVVVGLRESIASMNQDSPNLSSLRRDIHELENEYLAKGGRPEDTTRTSQASTPQLLFAPAPLPISAPRDASDEFRDSQVRLSIGRYNALLERLETARLELAGVRAAFKYRFVVARPPEQPRAPVSPRRPAILAGAFIAGLLVGALAALVLELRSGLLVQEWQVRRLVGLPVLART